MCLTGFGQFWFPAAHGMLVLLVSNIWRPICIFNDEMTLQTDEGKYCFLSCEIIKWRVKQNVSIPWIYFTVFKNLHLVLILTNVCVLSTAFSILRNYTVVTIVVVHSITFLMLRNNTNGRIKKMSWCHEHITQFWNNYT